MMTGLGRQGASQAYSFPAWNLRLLLSKTLSNTSTSEQDHRKW